MTACRKEAQKWGSPCVFHQDDDGAHTAYELPKHCEVIELVSRPLFWLGQDSCQVRNTFECFACYLRRQGSCCRGDSEVQQASSASGKTRSAVLAATYVKFAQRNCDVITYSTGYKPIKGVSIGNASMHWWLMQEKPKVKWWFCNFSRRSGMTLPNHCICWWLTLEPDRLEYCKGNRKFVNIPSGGNYYHQVCAMDRTTSVVTNEGAFGSWLVNLVVAKDSTSQCGSRGLWQTCKCIIYWS